MEKWARGGGETSSVGEALAEAEEPPVLSAATAPRGRGLPLPTLWSRLLWPLATISGTLVAVWRRSSGAPPSSATAWPVGLADGDGPSSSEWSRSPNEVSGGAAGDGTAGGGGCCCNDVGCKFPSPSNIGQSIEVPPPLRAERADEAHWDIRKSPKKRLAAPRAAPDAEADDDEGASVPLVAFAAASASASDWWCPLPLAEAWFVCCCDADPLPLCGGLMPLSGGGDSVRRLVPLGVVGTFGRGESTPSLAATPTPPLPLPLRNDAPELDDAGGRGPPDAEPSEPEAAAGFCCCCWRRRSERDEEGE